MDFYDSTYINRSRLADELGVSVATIRKWSKQEGFPLPVSNSGKVPIYRTDQITAWLESEVKS